MNEQGAKLCNDGLYDEAVKIFTKALTQNPRYAYAYHNRVISYRKLHQYRNAIADFTQAVALVAYVPMVSAQTDNVIDGGGVDAFIRQYNGYVEQHSQPGLPSITGYCAKLFCELL